GPFGGELEVVRRIERGAGSAYRVNGRDVRAKDVALVFADAATGAHSPALVSQGRIAAVIAAKPAERRMMLEEAAGIAGLHVRRRDAEQKLRATEANLARLDDMLAGLEGQIATLRRQARAAERYKSVSDKIRLAEARLVFARWRDAAAAADAARAEARAADERVAAAQALAKAAQDAQHKAAAALAQARDDLFDRRQDSSAHGQRMASLAAQLEAAEQRVQDIDRQLARIEDDRSSADRLTSDAAAAMARLETDVATAQVALAQDEARRSSLIAAADDADRAARAAEVALAQRVAEQAGIDAEWRVAEAAVAAAQSRLARMEGDAARLLQQAEALAREPDPADQIAQAETRRNDAAKALVAAEAERADLTRRREELSTQRDATSNALAQARAELSGIEREADALARDKTAREKAAAAKGRGASAISGTQVAAGYERALAAVLGRDAAAPVGPAPQNAEGRFWTGAVAPAPLPDSLAHHVKRCPPELSARLALVRVLDADDGQPLAPGEWLVTKAGRLRRWDGFVARGEGAAEAAALEAANRLTDLETLLPARREAVGLADAAFAAARDALGDVQAKLGATEKAISAASDAERGALRALDAAEAARARLDQRKTELVRAQADLAEQRRSAQAELGTAQDKRSALPDPAAGRAALDDARARNDAARGALQTMAAAMASLEQNIAVGRERLAGLKGDARAWQARAGDAAKRLADMTGRREELETERAISGAKPAGLIREIEEGEAIHLRLTTNLAAAESTLTQADIAAKAADIALGESNETLATAREGRAGASARADNEDARRQEMAGISGERFQCPPPMLPQRFEFDAAEVASAGSESAAMDRLVGERERIGPVNLVAADELAEAEVRLGTSVAEQAELTEAVHRLRGSIGNLNREGRERLRAAFEAVDGHFRRLFSRLFGGGEAHLALVDSDDPLEAGLEIFAQPPGKRLQSLTLLSGGEQALTAVALIFALFLTNPAPICVLDEVDAPLDDANIERFCDLLDAMVAETTTRYLIVTHNAVTMSRMHRLFGVTMVERGVSRLVSVDLGGAVELLENA
ncbi:MAG: chromosome segregation protein SMC, partial [Novosphingobium sp.]|nr:chromosome segregation protein SMC [Novosphingobium sp.]